MSGRRQAVRVFVRAKKGVAGVCAVCEQAWGLGREPLKGVNVYIRATTPVSLLFLLDAFFCAARSVAARISVTGGVRRSEKE